MFKAIIYKEWLKTRWAFAAVAVLNLAALITIYLKISSVFRFMPARTIYSRVIFDHILLYSDLRYVFLLSALIVALAQFLPEITQNRLKLSLHLPVSENKILLQMISFGFIFLTAVFVINAGLLLLISSIYFPSEILVSILYTTAPWMMSGITAYFIAAAASVEPAWNRRIIIILAGAGLVYFYLFDSMDSAYSRVILWFILLSLLTSAIVFISGCRFKRGYR